MMMNFWSMPKYLINIMDKLDDLIHEIACLELGDDQPVFQSDPIMARFKETGTEGRS